MTVLIEIEWALDMLLSVIAAVSGMAIAIFTAPLEGENDE